MSLAVSVYRGDTLIGHARLTASDPPMGVASGRLELAGAFGTIRAEAKREASGLLTLGDLSVIMADGNRLECRAGATGMEAPGEDPIWELDCVFIPYPLYENLFPGAYKAYEDSFRR